MNDKVLPSFWWVNQGTTYDKARKIGFIWAPKESKSGRPLYHWENVSRVRGGDFIFHYANGDLKAISRAKSSGYDAKKELGGSEWSDAGWRVDAEYCDLAKPVPLEEVGSKLAALHLDKGPIDKSGGVKQGYLFELPTSAAEFLIARLRDDPALQACGILQVIAPNAPDSGSKLRTYPETHRS